MPFNIIRMQGKEGNVSFNDALNTFYLRLYKKGPFIERDRNLAVASSLALPSDLQQIIFYMHNPTSMAVRTLAFGTLV